MAAAPRSTNNTPKNGPWGGKANNVRYLTKAEMNLIRTVFTTAKLPPLHTIRIGDGVNGRGGPWTDSDFEINIGPNYQQELINTPDAGGRESTLVHEMVHVWQYFNGFLTKAHAAAAQAGEWVANHLWWLSTWGQGSDKVDLYGYSIGQSWDDMGFEGQAKLVEDWFEVENMRTTSDRFVYVNTIIRQNGTGMMDWKLDDIKNFQKPTYEVDTTRPDPPKVKNATVNPFQELLEPVYPAGDQRSITRVEKLAEYCRNTAHPKELLARLKARKKDDRLAELFYARLSPASNARLIKILEERR